MNIVIHTSCNLYVLYYVVCGYLHSDFSNALYIPHGYGPEPVRSEASTANEYNKTLSRKPSLPSSSGISSLRARIETVLEKLIFHSSIIGRGWQPTTILLSSEQNFRQHFLNFNYQLSWECAAGGSESSRKLLVNCWLIIRDPSYWHRKYQNIQAMHQYQNINIVTALSC